MQGQLSHPGSRVAVGSRSSRAISQRADAGWEVWTVGHSTHSADAFVALLQAYRIEVVADVRRFPGSRRHPRFGAEPLRMLLEAHGIGYLWIRELGGRRRPDNGQAVGSAWRHPSFRAYAQHVQTEEFAQGLHTLLHLCAGCRTAIMCAELLWWRCHRALISDVLLYCGWPVTHILGASQSSAHRYTAAANDGEHDLSYDAGPRGGNETCC